MKNKNMIDVFKFEFLREFPIGNPTVTVYSYDRAYMDVFLNQHTFDRNNLKVDYITISESLLNPMNLLSLFKFKSNTCDDIFNIVTSPMIVEEAILNVAYDLAKTLYLGRLINNDNIEIFKHISSLISKLPHAFILDDPNDYEPILSIGRDYLDSYENNPYNKKIYESLFSDNHSVSNITVEGYVQSFTDMIISRYTLE